MKLNLDRVKQALVAIQPSDPSTIICIWCGDAMTKCFCDEKMEFIDKEDLEIEKFFNDQTNI
jgi:hypothetical protein